MYCSSCGAGVAQDISYCNRCGAKLSGAKEAVGNNPQEPFPESLVWAIVTVLCVGLGVTIGLMAMMKELLDLANGPIITFGIITLVLTFIIEGVFISLLLQRNRAAKEAGGMKSRNEHQTKELDEAKARALPDPVPSVTEQTTRAFEPIYSKQKSE
ncbi:MAG TPA: hypothetical protein VF791_12350 [Pyrinomonadaceae bacterium]